MQDNKTTQIRQIRVVNASSRYEHTVLSIIDEKNDAQKVASRSFRNKVECSMSRLLMQQC
jgi:hypothetical protein